MTVVEKPPALLKKANVQTFVRLESKSKEAPARRVAIVHVVFPATLSRARANPTPGNLKAVPAVAGVGMQAKMATPVWLALPGVAANQGRPVPEVATQEVPVVVVETPALGLYRPTFHVIHTAIPDAMQGNIVP